MCSKDLIEIELRRVTGIGIPNLFDMHTRLGSFSFVITMYIGSFTGVGDGTSELESKWYHIHLHVVCGDRK